VARDVLPFLFSHWVGSEVSSFFLLPIFTLVLIVPMCLFTRMTFLVIPSLVSMVCLVYLAGTMIYAFASSSLRAAGPVEMQPVVLFNFGKNEIPHFRFLI
jgi:hypothetical protein